MKKYFLIIIISFLAGLFVSRFFVNNQEDDSTRDLLQSSATDNTDSTNDLEAVAESKINEEVVIDTEQEDLEAVQSETPAEETNIANNQEATETDQSISELQSNKANSDLAPEKKNNQNWPSNIERTNLLSKLEGQFRGSVKIEEEKKPFRITINDKEVITKFFNGKKVISTYKQDKSKAIIWGKKPNKVKIYFSHDSYFDLTYQPNNDRFVGKLFKRSLFEKDFLEAGKLERFRKIK